MKKYVTVPVVAATLVAAAASTAAASGHQDGRGGVTVVQASRNCATAGHMATEADYFPDARYEEQPFPMARTSDLCKDGYSALLEWKIRSLSAPTHRLWDTHGANTTVQRRIYARPSTRAYVRSCFGHYQQKPVRCTAWTANH